MMDSFSWMQVELEIESLLYMKNDWVLSTLIFLVIGSIGVHFDSMLSL